MKTFSSVPQTIKTLLLGLVPALLIVVLTFYAFNQHQNQREDVSVLILPGKPLAAYSDLYPVDIVNGQLHLNKDIFMDAVHFFDKNQSPKAIADLIYLGQSNNVTLLLNEAEKLAYKKMLDRPVYSDLKSINKHRDKMFQVYKDIVNGIGQTFSGTGIEIVLHDTRNPLKSVVAIQNPITGRRLGDSTTNFGIQLIKDYSLVESRGTSYVSYGLSLKDGRNIKSSTVPLFNDSYGLIGFICMNIDISKLENVSIDNEHIANFISHFVSVNNNQKIEEMVDNSKRVVRAH